MSPTPNPRRLAAFAAFPAAGEVDRGPQTPEGVAAWSVASALPLLASSLLNLGTQIRTWGKPGRHGGQEIDRAFEQVAKVVEVIDVALPMVMAKPAALAAQIADEIERYASEAEADGDYWEATGARRDLAEHVRHLFDPPKEEE